MCVINVRSIVDTDEKRICEVEYKREEITLRMQYKEQKYEHF